MSNKNLDSSFSIFMNHRPERIAFLLNPRTSSAKLINAIFDFNLSKWGGRYNPIIPVFNETISDEYWQLLRFCDPDIVYSFPRLNKKLIEKIDRLITPFHFIYHKDFPPSSEPRISRIGEQISSNPLLAHVKKWFHSFLDEPVFLVCYNSDRWKYYNFFHRNFGAYDDRALIDRLPAQLKKLIVDRNSKPDDFFDKMTQTRGLVFPIELSELYTDFQEIKDSYRHDNFCIVVGNSLWDWIYFWNRIFLLSRWRRRYLSQVCIPYYFIESEEILKSFKRFLSLYIYGGGSGPPKILFVSHDIDKKNLDKIAKKVTNGINAIPIVEQLTKNSFPSITLESEGLKAQISTQHHYVSGKKVFIKNSNPFFIERIPTEIGHLQSGKTWMADIKIEYRPEKFFYTNQSYWWQLSRRGGLTKLFAPSRPGKITENGLISVQVIEKDKDIRLNIPDDLSLFHSILLERNARFYTDDVRQKRKSIPYNYLGISDKGRYLKGVLELFPSLWHASLFIESRYWRSILEWICHTSIKEEEKKLKPIKNKLNKIIPVFIKDPQLNKEWLARYILKEAKEQKNIAAEVDFDTLLEKLTDERKEFGSYKPEYKKFDITKKRNKLDLKTSLSMLTEESIFFQGVKPRCQLCGSKFWYYAEELNKEMVCKGCKSKLHLPVESKWSYRLNELILNAVAFHGVIPMIWALGHILSFSRNSFIFIPSICLFKNYDSPSPLAEIDLVCISDGDLIIGEIKTSADEFKSLELEKLVTVSKSILPEKVIIGAFNKPYNKLEDHRKTLSQNLLPLGIKVETIIPNSNCFEPCYHI